MPLSPQSEATTNLSSVFINLPMKLYNMWWLVTGLFQLAECFQGSSSCGMWLYLIYLYCWTIFIWMNIPHFGYIFMNWWTYGLFPHLINSVNIFVSIFVCIFLFFSGIYLWVKYLGHMITICLTFWKIAKHLQQQ